MSVVWRPRDENEEADALTNESFGAFDPARRIPVRWADLDFLVLPRLTAAAEELFKDVREARAAARKRPRSPRPAAPARPAGGRLREREPW